MLNRILQGEVEACVGHDVAPFDCAPRSLSCLRQCRRHRWA